MTAESVMDLVEFFAGEYPPPSPVRDVAMAVAAGRADAREALRALLTVRPPSPIAPEIQRSLDAYLTAAAAARGSINAQTLPTLSATHRIPGLFGQQVALWQGDLAVLQAGAVVNAANAQMLGCFVPEHRCIDNVLGAAAGPALRLECAAYMSSRNNAPEPTGRAVLTGGYHLSADHVIHTVGPIVPTHQPTPGDEAALVSCYRSILDLAHRSGLMSVGLCSISTGVFGYPKPAAARIALDTINDWLNTHPESRMRIIICTFADVDVHAYTTALAERNFS